MNNAAEIPVQAPLAQDHPAGQPTRAVPTLSPQTVALFSAIETSHQFSAEAAYSNFARIRRADAG